jgi:hypothetical protein
MSSDTDSPPVAFIIFNRPHYAREVFAAIRAARPSRLYVIADGPRPEKPTDGDACTEARALVEGVDWPCTVHRNFAPTNLGAGRRIASGLAWVFEQEPEAIVLEDDFVPHPDFFRFCAEMLARYRDDERVATIAGANFLAHQQSFPETEDYFFSRYYSIAGWATWRRAWRGFDYDVRRWPEFKQRGWLRQVYPDPYVAHYFDYAWEQCSRGERPDVWDFQWMFACAASGGLCVVPRVNLTTHIGVVGTHSTQASPNDHLPRQALYEKGRPLRHPEFILPNPRYDEPFFRANFHPASAGRPWPRTRRRLRAILNAVLGRAG